jgi:GR25 family glycosyltransferase involved in LPS biosynthesis
MRKKPSLLYNICTAVILLIIIYVVAYYIFGITHEGFQTSKSSPYFIDAYVITMDRYPERFPRIKDNAEAAGITLKKWPGVEIKKEEVALLPAKGVGTLLYTNRTNGLVNLGAIGCFLAHRGLLEHIVANPTGTGTFICEDDIVFPSDFFSKLAAVSSEIPEDWDIIFMRKYIVKGKPVSKHIIKLEQDLTSSTNMGTWGFIVKNASIEGKMLPILKQMTDAIDFQLGRNADTINTYLIDPPIIDFHETAGESIIEKMDKESKDLGTI